MSLSIAWGNASYGFREYGLREFFEASKQIGATAVEIDCGWLEEQSHNKIAVAASEDDVAAVKELAAEVGVNVAALGGGAVVGLEGEVAPDRARIEAVDTESLMDAMKTRISESLRRRAELFRDK